MAWLKDAYLDIAVLLLIVFFSFYESNIIEVVLWVYTSLLLLSKVLAFFMPSLQRKASNTKAPALFYHLIYALTVGFLAFSENYYLAGVWLIIWVVSVISLKYSTK